MSEPTVQATRWPESEKEVDGTLKELEEFNMKTLHKDVVRV